jgi:hypothetical protein
MLTFNPAIRAGYFHKVPPERLYPAAAALPVCVCLDSLSHKYIAHLRFG